MALFRRKRSPAPLPPEAPAPPTTAVQPTTPAAAQSPGPAPTPSPAPTPAASPSASTPAQPPTPLESLRGWVADLDRKLGLRTYIGAAAVVLCLAAAALAVLLAVDARDNSASDDDLNAIESQLATFSEQAAASSEAQTEVDALDSRLSTLETEVSDVSATGGTDGNRIAVIEDDIDDLRQQISDLREGGGGSSP